MAEENQITKGPQQGPMVPTVMKEPQGEATQPSSRAQPAQRVTTKNLKKVEVGRRLAVHNRKKREEQRKEQAKLEESGVSQYYGIRAVIALGVIGGLGYYIYQSRKGPMPREVTMPTSQQPWGHTATLGLQGPRPQAQLQTNKFEMD